MEANYILLNNKWLKKDIKVKVKRYPEANKNENSKSMGYTQSSPKREIHSNTGISQEMRNCK